MIDMEVDFHSSLCRSTTPNIMKRARSPEVGPLDRPLKRPILVLSRPSSKEYLTFQSPRSSPGIVNMHPVDDWVSQAGHLSIESPLVISDSEHSNVDEDTPMDDSQDTLHNPKPLHASSINIENVQLHLLESGVQGQRQDNTGYCINQVPTPSSDSHHRNSPDNTSAFSSASGASRLSSTEGDYRISMAAELRVQQKPRFAMGPRADCDLCRRGVKGHSAHWSS